MEEQRPQKMDIVDLTQHHTIQTLQGTEINSGSKVATANFLESAAISGDYNHGNSYLLKTNSDQQFTDE